MSVHASTSGSNDVANIQNCKFAIPEPFNQNNDTHHLFKPFVPSKQLFKHVSKARKMADLPKSITNAMVMPRD